MKIQGTHYRTIWVADDNKTVKIIDQIRLPHDFRILDITCLQDACDAISDMLVRGAPLIGATAGYGMALAMFEDATDTGVNTAWEKLHATRPTAINLRWALNRMGEKLLAVAESERIQSAYDEAQKICDEDVEINRRIGENGLKIIKDIADKKGKDKTINILTHCNAGWLATVDWGTATSPIYQAVEQGYNIHVWVDETRPRNQGAHLTSYELAEHGIKHTLIVDNAGGYLMQHGLVDMVIVGTDRTTASGDVCNKIGTYLKALSAKDNNVPFYVTLPTPTIDWTIDDGIQQIPIEQRSQKEVTHIQGKLPNGDIASVQISPDATPAGNPAFDTTPARLITGLITEKGIFEATKQSLSKIKP